MARSAPAVGLSESEVPQKPGRNKIITEARLEGDMNHELFISFGILPPNDFSS
jgi:hypothetical protein